MEHSYIYILTNRPYGALYIGVTSNLIQRVHIHKNKILPGFTNKYNIHRLVYFEVFDSIYEAIVREKKLKRWRRAWKIQLIESQNPNWQDLYDSLF